MAGRLIAGSAGRDFALGVIRFRYAIITVTLVTMAVLGLGVAQTRHSNDARVFFGPDNIQRLTLEEIERRFTENNDLLIAVAPDSNDVFTVEALAAIFDLTERAWRLPYAVRVDSLTNYQHSSAQGDDLVITDLVPEIAALTAEDLARIRQIALSEPLLVNALVSERGDIAGVRINLVYPPDEPLAAENAAAAANRLAREIEAQHPGVRLYLTGNVMLSAAFAEATMRDLTTLAPAMAVLIALMLRVILKSWTATLATLLVAGFSALSVLGAAGWMGIVLNPGSASSPTIVLTLGIASSVHIVTAMLERRRRGAGQLRAVVMALRVNIWPIVLTGLTTTIGFLSLNASESPPFRDLGNLVAFGVVVGMALALGFLPALLSLMPGRRPVSPEPGRENGAKMASLARFVIGHRRAIVWGSLIVAAVLATGIQRIELDDNWVEYFDHRFQLRQDTDVVRTRLTGVNAVDYMIDTGRDGGLYDPAVLGIVDRFAAWARSQPDVAHVFALTDILKRLNKNLHADDPAYDRLPETPDEVAQYLLLYEMSLPQGLDLNDRIDVAKAATRVTVTTRGLSSAGVRAFNRRAEAWFANVREGEPGAGFRVRGSGMALMFAYMSQRNIASMLSGTLIALTLVSALLVLALRSVRIGLLSLIPNLMPAIMGFGVWGWTVGRVGIAISIVAAVTFGIVVDDTIHLLTRYLRGLRDLKLSPAAAIEYAFSRVGKALCVTTAVLITGFSALLMSGFAPTWGLGSLASITLAFALVMDLLLLPGLLLWSGSDQQRRRGIPGRAASRRAADDGDKR